MKLSILTPAVPSRLKNGTLQTLMAVVAKQIANQPIEHLVLIDNKRRTVGEKRDALLRAAKGDYVAFVDDDDNIAENYVSCLMASTLSGPDVITFLQKAEIDCVPGIIEFKLGNPNEAFKPQNRTKRNAWHVCAWKRTLAIMSYFPAINYGEDIAFASKLWALPGLREVHVPEILHFYRHSSHETEAPPTSQVGMPQVTSQVG